MYNKDTEKRHYMCVYNEKWTKMSKNYLFCLINKCRVNGTAGSNVD